MVGETHHTNMDRVILAIFLTTRATKDIEGPLMRSREGSNVGVEKHTGRKEV